MRVRWTALSLLALIAARWPDQAAAQARAGGVVVRAEGPDSVPVPGVRVVLHRVGQMEQGPVDSTPADARGRFRFRFRADSGARQTSMSPSRCPGLAFSKKRTSGSASSDASIGAVLGRNRLWPERRTTPVVEDQSSP